MPTLTDTILTICPYCMAGIQFRPMIAHQGNGHCQLPIAAVVGWRRPSIAVVMAIPLSNEIRALLDSPNFAHLATLMPDGSPQSVPVWVGREPGYHRGDLGGGQVDLDRHEILTELDQHPHLVSLTRKARCNHHSNWTEDGPKACLTSLGAALVHLRLDLEKLGCDLTSKSRTMLGLRSSGFEGKEIAEGDCGAHGVLARDKRSTSKNLGRGLWGSSQ